MPVTITSYSPDGNVWSNLDCNAVNPPQVKIPYFLRGTRDVGEMVYLAPVPGCRRAIPVMDDPGGDPTKWICQITCGWNDTVLGYCTVTASDGSSYPCYFDVQGFFTPPPLPEAPAKSSPPSATGVKSASLPPGAVSGIQIIYPTIFADNNLSAPTPLIAYGIIGVAVDLECELRELGTPYGYRCRKYVTPVGHAWQVIFGNVPDQTSYLLTVRPKGPTTDPGDNVIFQVSARGHCCCH
ncbi:MAG TPA: hypothetical protein VKS79_19480 [Gemmataceae bacterium]|nr:hypothetical protein [Gemmataceae bacterium]